MTHWIKTPEPGIYPAEDVPAEMYHRWDAMSNTWLGRLVDTCPAQFRYWRGHPPRPTDAMRFGSMLHCLTLEAFDFGKRFLVAPECDRRTKAGKAAWAMCEATRENRDLVTRGDHELARAMAKAVQAHKTAWKLLSGGQHEVSIVWDDAESGVRCKARLDCLNLPAIPDLKSTINANPDAFVRAVWNFNYHLQSALYTDGVKAVTGEDAVFVFIPVQKTPPHIVIARPAGETVLAAGRHVYGKALDTYRVCSERNEWPGYPDDLEPLELPNWALVEAGLEGEVHL